MLQPVGWGLAGKKGVPPRMGSSWGSRGARSGGLLGWRQLVPRGCPRLGKRPRALSPARELELPECRLTSAPPLRRGCAAAAAGSAKKTGTTRVRGAPATAAAAAASGSV